MNILLNKQRSKLSSNTNSFVPIRLTNGAKLLPTDSLVTTINEVELYNQERQASNIVRLTCTINPICSNVLHNTITEIVKNEGSDDCFCLNFTPLNDDNANNLLYKNKSSFANAFSGVRDTQLSNEANGFQYHCGTDIFNNHILRSLTFKTVCGYGPNHNGRHDEFNTLADTMRSIDGKHISGYKDYIEEDRKSKNGKPSIKKLHLYLKEETLSFEESVEKRLIEENGWYGFINIGKFPTIDTREENTNEQFDIYKVINNRKPCDFIDMYPSRDLWYFTPKYNKHRKRIEKNWDYCLTYPSSSTTDIDFIRSGTNSLKVCMFDDTLSNSIGTSGLKLYSVSKHGLSKGDIINVYDGDNIIIRNTSVVDIEDDYTFSVYDQGVDISNLWYQLSNDDLMSSGVTIADDNYTSSGETIADDSDTSSGKITDDDSDTSSSETTDNYSHKYGEFKKFLVDTKGNKYPILPNKKVCLEHKDISYKKVVEGEELEYYVRIFSKIPNWKFVNKEPTEYEMYKKDSDLISRYQTYENDFESHVSRLAFSKNIYGDDISEIVFSDNIDLSHLKDNLGRPLSEIYLTIIKNNIGYKQWYGDKHNCSSPDIEFSHCFGKLNCAFKLSNHAVPFEEYVNATTINALEPIQSGNQDENQNSNDFVKKGLNIDKINGYNQSSYSTVNNINDEIQYRSIKQETNVYEIYKGNERLLQTFSNGIIDGNKHFYGDLCCYSNKLLSEQSIQMINFRFNTAQRELSSNETQQQLAPPLQTPDGDEPQPTSTIDEPFKYIYHEEIETDDYDNDNFSCVIEDIVNVNRLEGYCYVPHYKIQIHTFDDEIKTDKPHYIPIKDWSVNDKDKISCLTRNYHYFNENDIVYFSTFDGGCFQYQVTSIENAKRFICEPLDVENKITSENKIHRLFKPYDGTPSYATLSNDGSAHFMWRDFIKNGFDTENKVEQYPFMNNALYVNKNINLFVQRQDPDDVGHIRHASRFPTDAETNKLTNAKENNYYQEEDIEC